jgi:formate/nitrite transporter FocA (FNT family)
LAASFSANVDVANRNYTHLIQQNGATIAKPFAEFIDRTNPGNRKSGKPMSETAEKPRSPHLDAEEQDQASRHSTPRALVIHEIIRSEGEEELERTNTALALSGLAGGLSMGFSFLALALLDASMPDTGWRHAISSFGYSVGFIIVVLGRQQLFTENTLTAVLPVLTRRDLKTFLSAARLWAIVLLANIAGTWIFAAIIFAPNVFPPDVVAALKSVAQESIPPVFYATLVKSFFAGWLIALMVWILPAAQSAKIFVILIITYIVSLAHLSHIVAGSTEAAYDVLSGGANFGQYLIGFLIPTLIGNILGGVVLVTILNHGSIAPEIDEAN